MVGGGAFLPRETPVQSLTVSLLATVVFKLGPKCTARVTLRGWGNGSSVITMIASLLGIDRGGGGRSYQCSSYGWRGGAVWKLNATPRSSDINQDIDLPLPCIRLT